MTTYRVVGGILALRLWSATVVQAQELRYLGPSPGTPTGRIELAPGQVREVTVGDEIPGWGRVREVGDDHLIVERVLGEADQERLQSEGMMPYDVLELRILREDLRFPGSRK
jgi:hypothetical protein